MGGKTSAFAQGQFCGAFDSDFRISINLYNRQRVTSRFKTRIMNIDGIADFVLIHILTAAATRVIGPNRSDAGCGTGQCWFVETKQQRKNDEDLEELGEFCCHFYSYK